MNLKSVIVLCVLLVVATSAIPNVTDLIVAQGYPVQNYFIETSDGFLLNVIRIPYGRDGKGNGTRPVAFLQHGLLDSAAAYTINNYQESLAYILADNGFDVFLGNARGNSYSSQNKFYPPDSPTLWSLVDYDNMVAIDLPTMIDAALKISGAESLVYVGHSQGTLMGFGGFSSNKELAKKIDIFLALAPVAYVGNVESVLLHFLADLDLAYWVALFGEEEFMPDTWLTDVIGGELCTIDPIICANVIFLLCGYDPTNLNNTRLPVYVDYTPAGTSVRNMEHWTQGVASGQFKMFDYGTVGNLQHYNSTVPPQYYPQNLTYPPIAFFTGSNDILADPIDVQALYNALPTDNKPILWLNEPTYDHLDFTWGEDAHIKIYPALVQLALQYANPGRK